MRNHIKHLAELVIEDMVDWLAKGYSLSASVSWGKDSLAKLILMVEAVKRAKNLGIALPACTVISANTGVENTDLDGYCQAMGSEFSRYCEETNLPISYHVATPPLTSSFHYKQIGKGHLFLYPGMKRNCTLDWKTRPIISTKQALKKRIPNKQISLVGTRWSESDTRKKEMAARGDMPGKILRNEQGDLYATPIADWDVEDVWALIMYCDQRDGKALYHSFRPHFDETLMLYRDANGGECVAALGDKALNNAACGARFGCWTCTPSGEKDRSLTAMVEQGRHYLAPIATLRDWMFALRWDYRYRRLLSRLPMDEPVCLSPETFRLSFRKKLLRVMLTIDADERAAAMTQGIAPRFQLVTPAQLVAIDYQWMLDPDEDTGFSALRESYAIIHLGARYYLTPEDLSPVPKTEFPVKWFYDPRVQHLGLVSTKLTQPPRRLRSRAMTVDEVTLDRLIKRLSPGFFEGATPRDAVSFYLHSGIIRAPARQVDFATEKLTEQDQWRQFRQLVGCGDVHNYAYFMGSSEKDGVSRAA